MFVRFQSIRWLIVVLIVIVAAATANENIRLSRNIIPVSYVLDIDTFLNNETDSKFSGHVKINVKCANNTNEIVLHAKNLEIITNEIEIVELRTNSNDTRPVHVQFEQNNDRELIRLRSIDNRTDFESNKNYSISLKFRGNLTSNLVGYYLSSYRDEQTGRLEYLSVTHFEPTDARRAFPCFDEPDFKATFQINLRHHRDLVALSNMPLIDQSKDDLNGNGDYVWSRFEPSVRMSTYLVAYCLSKFVKTTAYSKRGTEINVWSRKSVGNQTNLAVEFAAKSLDYFENFFQINYPLKKSDLIALPDFSSGAMENWGLITFREKYLTLDNSQIRIRAKFNGYSVIAHELAHQWFGNLVTMKWWSDLWLNEGFATFMADLAVEQLIPEWAIFDSELVSSILSILDIDYLNSSHPVQATIQNPSEINEIFDWITYQKGSFVLYQLYNFLGERTFRNGISSYLREHQYANAEQDDLWRAFDRQVTNESGIFSQFSIKQIMDTWTKQNGFPLITIKRLPNDTLVFDQMKFSYDIDRNQNRESCWFVPLTFHFANEPYSKSKIPNLWLNPETCLSAAVSDNKPAMQDFRTQLKNNAWYTINNEFGYLTIVNYDRQNWDLLKDVLLSENRTQLSELNRVHLVTSAFSLANANLLSYEFVLDMMRFLANEDSFIVLKTGLIFLSDLEMKFVRTDYEDQFNKYYEWILMPLYEKYGGIERNVSMENYHNIQKWFTITSRACKLAIGNCADDAVRLFEKQNRYQNEAELLIFESVIRTGDSKVWNRFFKMLTNANDSNRRSTLLAALGKSTNTTILNQYLKNLITENSVIRKQDHGEVFNSVITNKYGFETAKNFFYENIARLQETNAATPTRLASLLEQIVHRLNSHTEIEKMDEFVKENRNKYFAKNTQSIEKVKELLKLNWQWLAKHSSELRNYLSKDI